MSVSQSELARADDLRKTKGWKWCAKRGVGPIRRGLGVPLPHNVAVLMERRDPRFSAREQREHAIEIWREFCRACPHAQSCHFGAK